MTARANHGLTIACGPNKQSEFGRGGLTRPGRQASVPPPTIFERGDEMELKGRTIEMGDQEFDHVLDGDA